MPFKILNFVIRAIWVTYDAGKDDQWMFHLESQILMNNRILTLSQISPLKLLSKCKT